MMIGVLIVDTHLVQQDALFQYSYTNIVDVRANRFEIVAEMHQVDFDVRRTHIFAIKNGGLIELHEEIIMLTKFCGAFT